MSDFLLLENQAQLYLIPSDAVIGNKDEQLQSSDHQEKPEALISKEALRR